MSRERVRKIARRLEWGALILVGVDILLYVVLVGPVGGLRASEESKQQELAARLAEEKEVVSRFEQFKNAAPQTSQELMSFADKHLSPRREAYYRAARLVRELADRSRLQLTGISYKLDPWHGEPLRRLSVEIRVAGPFDELLKFAHDLDTANQFVLLENCNLQDREGEGMAMNLTAEMYLEP